MARQSRTLTVMGRTNKTYLTYGAYGAHQKTAAR